MRQFVYLRPNTREKAAKGFNFERNNELKYMGSAQCSHSPFFFMYKIQQHLAIIQIAECVFYISWKHDILKFCSSALYTLKVYTALLQNFTI